LTELPPGFDDCPGVCRNEDDKPRSEFCESCPRAELQDEFRERLLFFLNERLGKRWERYGYDVLLQTLSDTLEIEGNEDVRLTTPTARLVQILNSERSKIERQEEWERKARLKTK
jgi:hypothetical protein